jgi:hypothetical protein
MSEIAEKLKELRFNRMRLGQSVGEIVDLPSEPSIKFAIVPLTEAEHEQCLQVVIKMQTPDNMVGAMHLDRRSLTEGLFRALRNPENLEERAFDSWDEMIESLEIGDINVLHDTLMEISESDNPSPGEFTEEELDEIKKALAGVDLNEQSGKQWYALKRYLSTHGLTLLPANSLGSTFNNLLTTTNDSEESMITADQKLQTTVAKSAESQ